MTVTVKTKKLDLLGDMLLGNTKYSVDIGVLEGAGKTSEGYPLAELAAVHEYGSMDLHTPERRWIRGTFEKYNDELVQMQKGIAKKLVTTEMTVEQALGLLGTWAVNKVKTHVKKDTITPDITQATKKAKGSSRPLIDTGLMVNSVTFRIDLKGSK